MDSTLSQILGKLYDLNGMVSQLQAENEQLRAHIAALTPPPAQDTPPTGE